MQLVAVGPRVTVCLAVSIDVLHFLFSENNITGSSFRSSLSVIIRHASAAGILYYTVITSVPDPDP
jgi:hypothetical protein